MVCCQLRSLSEVMECHRQVLLLTVSKPRMMSMRVVLPPVAPTKRGILLMVTETLVLLESWSRVGELDLVEHDGSMNSIGRLRVVAATFLLRTKSSKRVSRIGWLRVDRGDQANRYIASSRRCKGEKRLTIGMTFAAPPQ